jgi:hypothetical protein
MTTGHVLVRGPVVNQKKSFNVFRSMLRPGKKGLLRVKNQCDGLEERAAG